MATLSNGSQRRGRSLQILEASARLFFERGFAAVSIDEIGAVAGVSGPAIYRHFRGKAEILVALFELTMERLTFYVGPIHDEPRDELEALVRGQARLAVRHPALVRVFESEESALPSSARADFRRRQRAHVRRWITALGAIRSHEQPADLQFLSYAAIGVMLSAARWPTAVRRNATLESQLVKAAQRILEIAPRGEALVGP